MQTTRLYASLMVSFFFSATAAAQVFDLGPSDPALFTNVINLPGDFLPDEIGGIAGQTTQLNVASGGTVEDNFEAFEGSEVNISGGEVGRFLAREGSEVNISGGTMDGSFFGAGSVVNISGGDVESFSSARENVVNITGGTVGDFFDTSGEVNISGGSVGRNFDVRDGAVVNISGGAVGPIFSSFSDSLQIFEGGEVNISGGAVGSGFIAEDGSKVNLSGSIFFLDGELMDNLINGEPFTILDRNVRLLGLLDDGSVINFDLNSTGGIAFDDRFHINATLTVTLNLDLLLGDVNQDGVVNFLDISPFISILSTGDFLAEADINQDQEVNFLDISPFIARLSP